MQWVIYLILALFALQGGLFLALILIDVVRTRRAAKSAQKRQISVIANRYRMISSSPRLWMIIDDQTGSPAKLDGRLLGAMSIEDADEILDLLNLTDREARQNSQLSDPASSCKRSD